MRLFIIIMIISACNGRGLIEISDLENFQILFEKVGNLKVVNNYWVFEGHYDFEYLGNATLLAGQLYRRLYSICELSKVKGVKRLYESCIFHNRRLIEIVRTANKMIYNFRKQRLHQSLQVKEALANNMEYLHHFTEFRKNQSFSRFLASENISILSGFDKSVLGFLDEIKRTIGSLLEGRNDFIVSGVNLTIIDFNGNLSELIIDIERVVVAVINDLGTMTRMADETLESKLASLDKIHELIKETPYFPYDQLNFYNDGIVRWQKLSSLISMKSFFIDEKLCFEIHIPLIAEKSFVVYSGAAIPVPIFGNTYAQVQLKDESLLVDSGLGKIFPMSKSFLKSCVEADSNFFCKTLPSSLEGQCLRQLFVEAEESECNYMFQEIDQEYWKRTNNLDTWIFVSSNRTSGVLNCGTNGNETIFLNAKIGKLSLRKDCRFRTRSVELITGKLKTERLWMESKKISKKQIEKLREKLMEERFEAILRPREKDAIHLSNIYIIFLIMFLFSLISIEIYNTFKQRRLTRTVDVMRQAVILKNLKKNNSTGDLNPIMRDIKRSRSFQVSTSSQNVLENITFPAVVSRTSIYDTVKGCRPVLTNEKK